MPRSAFRRRGARMREYAAGAAIATDDSADGNGDGAAPAPLPPPPGLGMPFSRRGRRGRRGRQAAGETGSVIPKLLMKMVVYGVVMVAMKYGKKQGKDDASTSPGSPGGIVSRITFLLNDVLGGKSGDRVLLPGTKTLRVGTDDGADNRVANVYVVPNFLEDDVASRWRTSVAYELERSGSIPIPSSHPLSTEVSKTLASTNIKRKLRALGIDGMYVASTVWTVWEAMGHDDKNDGWTVVVVPISDNSSNHDTTLPKMRFACGPSPTDKQVGQEWCDTVELELNTAIVLDKSAKFEIDPSSSRHHFGVVGSYRAKEKEEL